MSTFGLLYKIGAGLCMKVGAGLKYICCGTPCFRQARICSDSSPSSGDTLSGDFMTCADAVTVGTGVWKDSLGRCVYFLFSDATTPTMSGTLYGAGTVTVYPDCTTCTTPPTGCSTCQGFCYSKNASLKATYALTPTITVTSGSPTSGQLADALAFFTALLNYTIIFPGAFCGGTANTVFSNSTVTYEIGRTSATDWLVNSIVNESSTGPDPTIGTYTGLFALNTANTGTGTPCGIDSISTTYIAPTPPTPNWAYIPPSGSGGGFTMSVGAVGTVSIQVIDNFCCLNTLTSLCVDLSAVPINTCPDPDASGNCTDAEEGM